MALKSGPLFTKTIFESLGWCLLSGSQTNSEFYFLLNYVLVLVENDNHCSTLVMAGLQRCQPWRGARGAPYPITLLEINSHAQNLACWCLRGFPIMSNLFHKEILHIPPWGDPQIWPFWTFHKIWQGKNTIIVFYMISFFTELFASCLKLPRTSLK